MPKDLRQTKHKLLTEWNVVKERLHSSPSHKLQHIKEGEVWWTGIGENIGVEINGKSEYFSRPVSESVSRLIKNFP